jgi:(1->4)-alpha-D-glucan 1-alpha-D-glucosylmutase
VIPRATYRLQFHAGFTFADAEQLVPYFAELGISHLYASPIMKARPDSTHGYDVVDPATVSPALGGEEALRRLAAKLRQHEMGLIVDIVPNHMAADVRNPWWRDVLAQGRASRYARFFDIDWEQEHRVVLPLLGAPLDRVLEEGGLSIVGAGDALTLRYGDLALPLAKGTANDLDAPLSAVLERQHYRLVWWRIANDCLNWRRFFDINDLVALRMEEDEVFDAVHDKILTLYRDDVVDGLRVDHVDGLANPGAYCRRLRARLDALDAVRRRPGGYLVVEKILGGEESLPVSWPVQGTTGYDFMNEVSALQHDESGAQPLGDLWHRLSGRPATFAAEEAAARGEILDRAFGAQFQSVVDGFLAAGESAPEGRLLTRPALQRCLKALLVGFDVYRPYPEASPTPGELSALARAVDRARQHLVPADHWLLDALAAWLRAPDDDKGSGRHRALTRFAQLSAPIAARAVEDTGFYRFGRLLSRNDVGFDAGLFALTPDAFHRRMQLRATRWPAALLATATHDHKRGEDVRARLAVLSTCTSVWEAVLTRWIADATALMAQHRSAMPDTGDVVMLLQTMVGAWPIEPAGTESTARYDFADRLVAWQVKALREAKRRTDWTCPDKTYEALATRLIRLLLTDEHAAALRHAIGRFAARIGAAGAVNGLVQTVLKLTVPGVPDIYQGTERWDLSLVDPDNRRPVDFPARQCMPEAPWEALLETWHDGRVKQTVIRRLLCHRRGHPTLFADGQYEPVAVAGPRAQHLLAFRRRYETDALLVVVPRALFNEVDQQLKVASSFWQDTCLRPSDARAHRYRCILRDRPVSGSSLAELLHPLPFAVLAEDGS